MFERTSLVAVKNFPHKILKSSIPLSNSNTCKCCQCENVANANTNSQLEIGNIGTGYFHIGNIHHSPTQTPKNPNPERECSAMNSHFSVRTTKLRQRWRDETALAAHSASGPFVKNVAIINDCGEMKIEKFEM